MMLGILAAVATAGLVIVGADGRPREAVTEGAVVRSTADLRLSAPSGADVRLTLKRDGAAVGAFDGKAPLVPERSLLAGSPSPGPVVVEAEIRREGLPVETHRWQLTVLGDVATRSPAGTASKGEPTASMRGAAATAPGAPSLQFAQRVAARRGGAEERTRGAREAALFRQWAPGVVLISTRTGLGSGAIVNRAERLIVTNYHVVGGESVVQVAFKPRSEDSAANSQVYRGEVVRYDQVADLALVRVSEMPAWAVEMKLGSLSGLEPGVDVHAIGHPTGELWSYTQGIVSQVRRNYTWEADDSGVEHQATVIQTQTPINPGNSGGPLIDDSGNIVGINSFGVAQAQGLNFAVSVEQVRSLLAATSSRDAAAKGGAGGKGGMPSSPGGKGGGGKGGGKGGGGKGGDVPPGDRAGRPNVMIYVDGDGDGRIDTVFSDRNGDGTSDMRIVDEQGDGKPDAWYLDENGDGQPDLMGRDTDGDGRADVWRTING